MINVALNIYLCIRHRLKNTGISRYIFDKYSINNFAQDNGFSSDAKSCFHELVQTLHATLQSQFDFNCVFAK